MRPTPASTVSPSEFCADCRRLCRTADLSNTSETAEIHAGASLDRASTSRSAWIWCNTTVYAISFFVRAVSCCPASNLACQRSPCGRGSGGDGGASCSVACSRVRAHAADRGTVRGARWRRAAATHSCRALPSCARPNLLCPPVRQTVARALLRVGVEHAHCADQKGIAVRLLWLARALFHVWCRKTLDV